MLPHWKDTAAYGEWVKGARAFGKAIWEVLGERRNPAHRLRAPGRGHHADLDLRLRHRRHGRDLRRHDRLQRHRRPALPLDAAEALQGSHFANDDEAKALNELVLGRQVDPCLSQDVHLRADPARPSADARQQAPARQHVVLVGATDFGLVPVANRRRRCLTRRFPRATCTPRRIRIPCPNRCPTSAAATGPEGPDCEASRDLPGRWARTASRLITEPQADKISPTSRRPPGSSFQAADQARRSASSASTLRWSRGRGAAGEIGVQECHRVAGEGDVAGLAALAGQRDQCGWFQAEVADGEVGEFLDPGRGVVEGGEQRAVAAACPGGPVGLASRRRVCSTVRWLTAGRGCPWRGWPGCPGSRPSGWGPGTASTGRTSRSRPVSTTRPPRPRRGMQRVDPTLGVPRPPRRHRRRRDPQHSAAISTFGVPATAKGHDPGTTRKNTRPHTRRPRPGVQSTSRSPSTCTNAAAGQPGMSHHRGGVGRSTTSTQRRRSRHAQETNPTAA